MPMLNDKEEVTYEDIGYTIPGKAKSDERFQAFKNEDDFYLACKEIIITTLNKSQDRYDIALSGGSLRHFYSMVSEDLVDAFKDTVFWQVDERHVPHDDEQSNFKLIMKYLLNNLSGYSDFKYFNVDFEGSELVLRDYESKLVSNDKFNNITDRDEKFFDLVILGVGMDGHIGSIFSNSDAVKEESRLVAYTSTDRFQIKDRFTLTFPAIMNSEQILVYLYGKSKKTIFENIQSSGKTIQEFPVMKLLEHPNVSFLFGNF